MKAVELNKVFDAKDFEDRIYSMWKEGGFFRPAGDGDKDPFVIVIPPPNVTGVLHMGHGLNNSLQDILIRYWRMQGRPTLWVPGTDHAGIATQMVVERQLMERQEPNRRTLGREKFIERIWQWKEESGNTIIGQILANLQVGSPAPQVLSPFTRPLSVSPSPGCRSRCSSRTQSCEPRTRSSSTSFS